MPSEFPMNDPQNIWKNQPTEPFTMSANELCRKAQQHERKARFEALYSIIAGLILFVFFAWRFVQPYEAVPRMGVGLLSLWRSFAYFDQRCSLRTWVYRIAHNVATGHVIRQRRIRNRLVSIENIETMPGSEHGELVASQAEALDLVSMLIQRLKPLDRQIIVSYLEGMDASSIGEITGLSPPNIAMKVHRIKNVLRRWFGEGGPHAE